MLNSLYNLMKSEISRYPVNNQLVYTNQSYLIIIYANVCKSYIFDSSTNCAEIQMQIWLVLKFDVQNSFTFRPSDRYCRVSRSQWVWWFCLPQWKLKQKCFWQTISISLERRERGTKYVYICTQVLADCCRTGLTAWIGNNLEAGCCLARLTYLQGLQSKLY